MGGCLEEFREEDEADEIAEIKELQMAGVSGEI